MVSFTRHIALVFLAVVTVMGLSPVMADDRSEIAEKVDALLGRMTLEEKVGQLNQYNGFSDFTGPRAGDEATQRKFQHLEQGLVGSMLNVVGVDQVTAVQKIAVEKTRLGIPVIFGFDVIHGQKTIFPIPLAEAASWDLAAIEQGARIAAVEAAAQGVNWTFAPMIDISRDARWGRVMEGGGEDPYLGSRIGVARVKGFQGTDLSAVDTIAATAKHFAGYGFAEAGRDYNAADVGTVTLFNTILPPFLAAIEEADVRTVMNAFNTVNGIPATGDEYLQRDVLKGKWGFRGFVVSDWGSGKEMIAHGFARDDRHAAELAIKAGSDMDMESYVYVGHLVELVREGVVEEALIDDAVRRILTIKYELGLFDDPYRYLDKEREGATLYTEEHLTAARDMAQKSVVLLKNDGALLPLVNNKRVAVIGALAADKDTPLGSWRGRGEKDSAVSLLEGLEAAGVEFTYANGADVEVGEADFLNEVKVNETDTSGFAEAVELAQTSDIVVMVLGEDGFQSGEGRSRTRLDFPGVQQQLLEAVHAVNQNIVLVVMSGRPLVLTWADENVPSIVQAWHLGSQAGHALTSVLTGEYNPSGKLPMTFPRHIGQVPIYYNHLNTGRPGPSDLVFWSHYIDETNAPLYPFGHGLSYTTFKYSDLRIRKKESEFEVSVRVRNTGNRAGDEVVQLYIRDRVASVSRPVRELKGFEKINLRSSASKRVRFRLSEKELGFYNPRGEFVVEPGMFDVFVGGSSKTSLAGEIEWQ